MRKTIKFWRTTAIGGLIFLLPLIVVVWLVGKVVQVVLMVMTPEVTDRIQEWSLSQIMLLISLTIVGILSMCFAAGMVARWSIGKRLSEAMEKNLLLLFPRYSIFKAQLAGSIGGDAVTPRMKPVLARFDDAARIGFELERSDEGLVAVFFPGAPDPWSGKVMFVSADRVEPLGCDFGKAVATFEKLGRDSAALLADKVVKHHS